MQEKAQASGHYIEMKAADGSGTFRGYLALPAAGTGPGLVIAQEIFGINHTMREVADYYAEEGSTVVAPLHCHVVVRCQLQFVEHLEEVSAFRDEIDRDRYNGEEPQHVESS